MKCPRDQSILVFTDEGLHPRNKCRACNGLLVSKEEVLAVLDGKSPDAAKLGALPASGLSCPRDGSPLRRIEHEEAEVDVCLDCYSVWLDAGELDKILARGRKAKRKKVGAAVAGAAAVAAAAQPAQAQSLVSSIGQGAAEFVAEGAIEIAVDLVGDAIGAVLGGLFS